MSYVNLPRKISRSFYQQCKNSFVEIVKDEVEIVAVYLGGTESNPGISDLDFILCLKNDMSEGLDVEKKLNPSLRNILAGGTILKLNEDNFSEIKKIDDFSLSYLMGDEFEFKEYTSREYDICRVMDWLPERLYALLKLKLNDKVDVILGLQIMKSLTVSLRKLSQITSNNYDEYIDSVITLRANWFKDDSSLEKFSSVLDSSLLVAQEGLNDLSDWLLENKYINEKFSDSYGAVLNIESGPKFVFKERAVVEESVVIIPAVFGGFFWAQANILNNSIAKALKASFSGWVSEEGVDERLLLVLDERMRYVNELALFLRKSNIESGLLKYGWFL